MVGAEDLQPTDRFYAFLAVLDRDAGSALAAIELVLAQPSISSQLVDNLNASIHVRTLLTNLFLIDEVLDMRTFENFPGLRDVQQEFMAALASSSNRFVLASRFTTRAHRLLRLGLRRTNLAETEWVRRTVLAAAA